MVNRCQNCGIEAGQGVAMISLYAPGIAYMCTNCIELKEKETGLIGMVFYSKGLKFLTPEEVAALPPQDEAEDD